ncbi:MAG: BTAD domain-containing putative transcriptional regulator [Anaerolineales bacterium]|jgi:WD40 repeat protein/DNA-binding SARP family transcriptional activator
MLQVRLLGQYEVRQGGQPVEIPSRPAQSLLAFLILSAGTAHRRERLAALFWPESEEANARSYLRHALWRLRKSLGEHAHSNGHFFISDEFSISFEASSDFWLDAAILDKKVEQNWGIKDYIASVSVYHGDLLQGFDGDWVLLERERLRAVFQRKMQALLDLLVEAGRWSQVLEWSERWIALGGTPEPAYRALMLAHYAQGDLSGVATAYQRCLDALRHDLDVEPSEQTDDLFQRLSRGEVSLQGISPGFEEFGQVQIAGDPPYKGLQNFDQDDAELFFGREALTAAVVSRLSGSPAVSAGDRWDHFLAVVGASGSGKSSLVRAGVVPLLERGGDLNDATLAPATDPRWQVRVLTPGPHPLEALATSLTRESDSVKVTASLINDLGVEPSALYLFARKILGDPDGTSANGSGEKLLLFVDQFEEVFTLCRSQVERDAFVANLMTAVEAAGPVCVLIALRSDFYAHCGGYSSLRDALERQQVYIGPMSADELRRAVTGPAELRGWEFEPGLIDFLLQEVKAEPGGLPLLSHALLETWQRRRGRTLTFAGYRESGGVRGAIARTAEQAYQELDADQKSIAQNIFLRLTELGEDRGDGLVPPDTRRQANLAELTPQSGDQSQLEAVLQKLAKARLITLGDGKVEVAHEVLIREWPTLRGWLDENREALQIHRRLTRSAQTWEQMGRDPGELYRGARLARAGEWATRRAGEMAPLEREFLQASQDLADRQEAEREARRQREIESAQKLAQAEKQRAEVQTRSNRRLRRFAVGLGLILIVAIGSALFALRQTNQSRQQTRLATARELASAALNSIDVDPERSVLLALRSAETTQNVDHFVLPEAEDALHKSVQAMRVQFTVPSTGGVAFSSDGKLIATTDLDNTAKIRDASTGQELLTLSGHTGQVMNLAFSPDGQRIVTTSLDGTAKIWDLATGKELITLVGHTDGLITPTFSADGSLVATTSFDCTARIWDAATGELLHTLNHLGITSGPDFSPDGRLLAVPDHTEGDLCDPEAAPVAGPSPVRIWDVASGEEVMTLAGHIDGSNEADFSPDGTRLFTVGTDTTAKMWDVSTGEELLTLFHPAWVYGGDFSSDGSLVATGALDGVARVWDADTGRQLITLNGHAGGIGNVKFSPDGTRLITGSDDGTARVWDITPQGSHEWLTFAGHSDLVFHVAYSPDGTRVASASWDGTAKVWDADTGKESLVLTSLVLKGHDGRLAGIAFSPDGARIATSGYDGTAKIYDAISGQDLLTIAPESGAIYDVAFSPDGKWLATSGEDGSAHVWQTSTGEEVISLEDHSAAVFGIAFSPDGARLATASDDGTAKIWDLASGEELLTLSGHTAEVRSVAFSPDGRRIATGSFDTTVKIWDAETGELLYTLSGHTNPIWRVKFSPGGDHLASSGFDSAKVWDLKAAGAAQANPVLNTFPGDFGPGIAFSPDGKRLAVPTQDGTVRIYVLPVEELMDLARSRLTRTWTSEECQQYLHLDQCPPDLRTQN